jgi:hypothetical protein
VHTEPVHAADDGKLATNHVIVYEGGRPFTVAETHPHYRPGMIDVKQPGYRGEE